MINPEFLAEKHEGMRVSLRGFLGRIKKNDRVRADQEYMMETFLEHIKTTADKFYAGDIKVVDEFFQLYCLDDERPVG